jgi:hypothetical protein
MAKKVNARQYYKDYFGIDFGDEYVIHHMDCDSENNDISNLLLMPKKLHSKYNMIVNGFCGNKGEITIDFKIKPECGGIHLYNYNMMKQLCETMYEINEWVKKKSDLQMAKYNAEHYPDLF